MQRLEARSGEGTEWPNLRVRRTAHRWRRETAREDDFQFEEQTQRTQHQPRIHYWSSSGTDHFRNARFQPIFQINNTMAAFRRKIPSLRTVDDLRHWIRTKLPEKRYLLDTNYLLSHLEQEIMYLSTKFIGSPLSSWTQTVFFDRMAVDIDGQFIKRY